MKGTRRYILLQDTIPFAKKSPLTPRVEGLALFQAYPFNTASGTVARRRPGNGHQPRSRGRFVRESV
jgi:hypothetical protein